MADAYEREQMPGVGAVLLRRKISSPRWMMAAMTGAPLSMGLLGGSALAALGLATGAPDLLWPALGVGAGGVALSAFFAVLNVTFASARIAVSEGELHVQLGMAGPRIPIAAIRSVRLAPSGINKVGMGVGKDLRGTTWYRLWGDNARAVHVEHDGGTLVLVAQEPDAIAGAITEALARHRGGPTKVRVELGAAEPDVIEQSESEQAARTRSR